MPSKPVDHDRHSRLLALALLWLLGGMVSLATTLIPAHTVLLGWAPTLWLLVAPLAVLLTLEPGLPRQLLALWQSRRRAAAHGLRY